jgi:hypothetical protein
MANPRPKAPPPAVDEAGDVPRRPDAVVIERESALPAPVDRAEAKGVVALREPVGAEAIFRVVRQLVDAWERGSLEDLSALLSADAGPWTARERGKSALTESWRQRLQAHEFNRLAGVELVRPERVEHWVWDDLGTPGAPARPADMRPGEILVRAPLEVTRVSGEKLFGDAMILILRREAPGLRIVAYDETDEVRSR